jgi:hypothetical protein
VVLEVTAKTDKGTVTAMGKKEYWEIGLDLDGRHRLGAWQIKEILDLTLPPRRTTSERFMSELPADTKSAEVEVLVTYHPSAKTTIEVGRIVKTLHFGP